MAKIYGLFGSMTGKLADVVMSVRNGEQIARKYQPVVFNPNTEAQVANRAKLKTLSQLSAVMAPVIGFRKQGAVSPRNLFVKANHGVVAYADDTATVNLPDVKVTSGVLAFNLNAAFATGNHTFTATVGSDIDRVVFGVFVKPGDELRLVQVSSEIPTDGVATLTVASGQPLYCVAYGIRFNSEAARVLYGNMEATSPLSAVQLLVSSSLNEQDVTLTESKGIISGVE